MSSINEPETVTPLAVGVKKAAPMIGVSVSTIWTLIRQGKLPTKRVGTRRLIPVSALKALLDPAGGTVEIDPPAKLERVVSVKAERVTMGKARRGS
jgi:excisionase family DNA binding protein